MMASGDDLEKVLEAVAKLEKPASPLAKVNEIIAILGGTFAIIGTLGWGFWGVSERFNEQGKQIEVMNVRLSAASRSMDELKARLQRLEDKRQ